MSNSPKDEIADSIAVIGMSGRFPGARNVDELWRNLRDGVEPLQSFTDEEMIAAGVAPDLLRDPDYVKQGTVLDDVDRFDASFFGYTPREAQLMDPQHRVFLECAWSAVEHAGYDTQTDIRPVGVFAGLSMNTYLINHVLGGRDLRDRMESLDTLIGSDKDFLATRVSYQLGLTGPSMVVQTTCSTSLVAVAEACRSLLGFECDMSLAGGVSIRVPQRRGYLYQQGSILSPDGHCRPFDGRGRGTFFSNAVGVVVLKRLDDALNDGDTVHAVIRGSAINNDGADKLGYTAPSIEGQSKVIALAQELAGVEPEDISYVEAHGTATELGDPVEVAALTRAFRRRTSRSAYCALGSIKSNLGHMDTAAGVAGLIKTVLALRNRKIPPSLHFESPNPQIDFDASPFFVNPTLLDWESPGGPRRAGVSAFGIGGTNAHVVLEEAPPGRPRIEPNAPSPADRLIVLSAKTDAALDRAAANLAIHLRDTNDLNLRDVAYTLQVGRRAMSHRRAFVCREIPEAIAALERSDRTDTGVRETTNRPVVFLFPGQGAQRVGAGAELYEKYPQFRDTIDDCARRLMHPLGLDLRGVLYPQAERRDEAERLLARTEITQPALFVLEYALATLLESWGIRGQAMLGHSIGEYVAACLAHVFSLDDALKLVATRGRLMGSAPPGKMLAVALPAEEARSVLGNELSLAAINGPEQCVVSGASEVVERLRSELNERGVPCALLRTSHAFHSAMMDPILDAFREEVRRVEPSRPRMPFLSNVTGTWITPGEAIDPDYWVRQLRGTVHFGPGLQTLLEDPERVLIEVGPGDTLSRLARRAGASSVVTSLPASRATGSEITGLADVLGRIWCAGLPVDWSATREKNCHRRVVLPTYSFQRERHWVEARRRDGSASRGESAGRTDLADWFYLPSWRRSTTPARSGSRSGSWLVFCDAAGIAEEMARRLAGEGSQVVRVHAGSRFERAAGDTFTLRPREPNDYDMLCEQLRREGTIPGRIAHLWGVTGEPPVETIGGNDLLDRGFYGLLFLLQSLARREMLDDVKLGIVTRFLHEVTGEEPIVPEQGAGFGLGRVVGHEFPTATCLAVDLDPNGSADDASREAERLIAELQSSGEGQVVAYRGAHRWVRGFERSRWESADTPLSEGCVCLITGGLGGIGLALAGHLAGTSRAKLVLMGRRGLAEGASRVRDLERAGGEVAVVTGDVTREEDVRQAFRVARERFGGVDLVVHAAGVLGSGPIASLTPEDAAEVLAAKVRGTRVLDGLCRDEQPRYLVLCSSLAATLGGSGLSDYAAANGYLDAFAQHRRARERPRTLSIDWDAWSEVGMGADSGASAASGALSPAEGCEVFVRVLARAPTQVLISKRDLNARLQQSEAPSPVEEGTTPSFAPDDHPRTEGEFVAPSNETEKAIAEIWSQLLGIERLAVRDNFFDLGGHSLLATQVLNRLRKKFADVSWSMRSIFDHPTVAELASFVLSGGPAEESPKTERLKECLASIPAADRASLLREYLRERVADALQVEAQRLPADGDLAGHDPAPIVAELIPALRRDLDFAIYPNEIVERLSIPGLVEFLEAELNRPAAGRVSVADPLPPALDDAVSQYRRSATGADPPVAGPIFLLCAPRSGSTLLQLMLSAHSGLFCPPELWLLGFAGMRPWDANPLAAFYRDGLVNALASLTGTTFDGARPRVARLVEDGASVAQVYRQIADLARPRRLVDKTPAYSLELDTLRRAETMFDRASYIQLVRHPYAVIDSFVRARFDRLMGETGDPHSVAERYWRRCVGNAAEFGKQVGSARFRRLRFEDLLANPREKLEDLCAFAGLPFEDALLRPYTSGRFLAGAGDPNIMGHDAVEARLGQAWKRVRLPRPLEPETWDLARSWGYELPKLQAPGRKCR